MLGREAFREAIKYHEEFELKCLTQIESSINVACVINASFNRDSESGK